MRGRWLALPVAAALWALLLIAFDVMVIWALSTMMTQRR